MQAWRLWSLDLVLSCRNRGRIGAPRIVVSIIHGVGERIADPWVKLGNPTAGA